MISDQLQITPKTWPGVAQRFSQEKSKQGREAGRQALGVPLE